MNFPGTVSGLLLGCKRLREESVFGEERFSPPVRFGIKVLWNRTPYVEKEVKSKTWIITHMQKETVAGFLRTRPFGFHLFVFFVSQARWANGGWIPGSEKGLYIRLPGYRWDTTDGMKWTWGRIGTTWD